MYPWWKRYLVFWSAPDSMFHSTLHNKLMQKIPKTSLQMFLPTNIWALFEVTFMSSTPLASGHSVSTLLCLCRSSGEGRSHNPVVYSWHMELWCQPHSCTEPDSLVNWQSFHLLERNLGILSVTCCTAAAISQTQTSLKYGTAASEVHMVVKGQSKKQGMGKGRKPN